MAKSASANSAAASAPSSADPCSASTRQPASAQCFQGHVCTIAIRCALARLVPRAARQKRRRRFAVGIFVQADTGGTARRRSDVAAAHGGLTYSRSGRWAEERRGRERGELGQSAGVLRAFPRKRPFARLTHASAHSHITRLPLFGACIAAAHVSVGASTTMEPRPEAAAQLSPEDRPPAASEACCCGSPQQASGVCSGPVHLPGESLSGRR